MLDEGMIFFQFFDRKDFGNRNVAL